MKRLWKNLLVLPLILSSCYRATPNNTDSSPITLNVAMIPGDQQGVFNSALVKALTDSGRFICKRADGDYILEARIENDNMERVGFQYDRDPVTGDLRKNLVGTENRRNLIAKVQVVEALTQKVVFGPQDFPADVVFDYVDSDNLYDLSFIDPAGTRVQVLNFSLGQLDTIEGAQDASGEELFRSLAQTITDEMLIHGWK